jgi:peptidoglycan/LPS O-acetylase OafA/YrhL
MAARAPLPALTGLRFVAAALVVAYHAHAMIPAFRTNPYLTFLGAGYTGVSLFFVLSGFVLTYNYLEPDGRGVTSVRDFLIARLARVYPVYLLGLVLGAPILFRELQKTGGMSLVLREGAPIAAANLLLLQAWVPPYSCRLNCPGWSLSAEAFFYLLFPFIGALLVRRQQRSLLLIITACWVTACAVAFGYMRLDPDHIGVATAATDVFSIKLLKFNPLVRLPEFVLGIAAGLLFLRAPTLLGRSAALVSIVGALAIGAAYAVHEQLPYAMLHNGLLAPLFAVVIFALAAGGGPLAQLLSTRTLHVLGEASFALYLLHVAVLVYVIKALGIFGLSMERTPALTIVYAIVVQLIAIAVLKWIEEPARKAIRKRFQRSASGVKTAPQRAV